MDGVNCYWIPGCKPQSCRSRLLLCAIGLSVIVLIVTYKTYKQSSSNHALPGLAESNKLNDLKKQLNVSASQYLISNSLSCSRYKPHLVIFVYSAPMNFMNRSFIREFWGRREDYIKDRVLIMFLIGHTANKTVHTGIISESDESADIIYDISYEDAYRNLTYKGLSMLRWIALYCSNAKMVLKVDEDTLIIPNRLFTWLKGFGSSHWPEYSVFGHVWNYPDPIRRTNSKWYVSVEEWPDKYYAEKACSGFGYLITVDAVELLLLASREARHLWVEDMYMTGVLAGHAKINHIHFYWNHILKYDYLTYIYIVLFPSAFIIGSLPSQHKILSVANYVAGVDSIIQYRYVALILFFILLCWFLCKKRKLLFWSSSCST